MCVRDTRGRRTFLWLAMGISLAGATFILRERVALWSREGEPRIQEFTRTLVTIDEAPEGALFLSQRVALRRDNAGWSTAETRHFLLLHRTRVEREMIQLARELEAARTQVLAPWFGEARDSSLSVVRIFPSAAEYAAAGGPAGSGGCWKRASGELLLLGSGQLAEIRQVAFHEAFHQYLNQVIGEAVIHPWFGEGHGDLFAGIRFRGAELSIEPLSWRAELLKAHLAADRDLVPLQRLVRMSQGDYYTDAPLKYAQGWALVYFLRMETDNAAWAAIPDRYLNERVEGRPGEAAFTQVEFRALEQAYRDWLLDLP